MSKEWLKELEVFNLEKRSSGEYRSYSISDCIRKRHDLFSIKENQHQQLEAPGKNFSSREVRTFYLQQRGRTVS